jgi:transposase-like protein
VVTVDNYGAIRRTHRDGRSIRQIARQFGHSRQTVRHALGHANPHPKSLTRNRAAPKLGPFQAVIDQILVDDQTAPPKQRHAAAQTIVASATRTTTPAAMPRSGAISARTGVDMRRHSYLWGICRADVSRPISDISTSISPMAASPCRSW